jgi:hypothetical protein
MPTAFDYREMARECLAEAEGTTDAARKKTLLEMAKLYSQTALTMDSGDAITAEAKPAVVDRPQPQNDGHPAIALPRIHSR